MTNTNTEILMKDDYYNTAREYRPSVKELEEQLAKLPEEKDKFQAWYKKEQEQLKLKIKVTKDVEAEERKRVEKEALEQIVEASKSDRDKLISLKHNIKGNFSFSSTEMKIIQDFLEHRIKRHTDFIANPVGK